MEGNVTFDQQGSVLNVISQSERAVVSYITFNLANGETVNFILPGVNASILNRVIGGQGSSIAGIINSNGRVGLVNTAGINIASTAQIRAASLLATTLNVTDQDFFGNTIRLAKEGQGANIVNEGDIRTDKGGYALIAASGIVNSGSILAEDGSIHLAVGDKITFHLSDNSSVEVMVDEGIQHLVDNLNVAIGNNGSIKAHAVELKAKLADGVMAHTINNEGVIQGTALASEGGQINILAEGGDMNTVANRGILFAGANMDSPVAGRIRIKGNTNYNSGAIVASGGMDEAGGRVEMLGDTVINEGSYIDVSGGAGGGTVLVGGDYQGTGDTYRAKYNFTDSGTEIYADAFNEGNGGKVIFWSDEDTHFQGNIFARGGSVSGNGGFAEVSGHGYLDFQGEADLTAANGEKGQLLLDPSNITIYGNVTPQFQSTDGTVNLANNLKFWMDSSDPSMITLTYTNSGLSGTASGSSGSHTITTSANLSSILQPGTRIRLTGAGAVTTASTLGANTYTIASISGTTITTVQALTTNYTNTSLFRGAVSQLADKSGTGNTFTQATAANMPIYIESAANGLSAIRFDGVNDQLTANVINTQTTNTSTFIASTPNSTSIQGAVFKNGNANTGYGIGYGNTTFDNGGNNFVYLREQVQWHGSGVSYGGAGSNIVSSMLGATNIVNYLNSNSIQTINGVPNTPTTTTFIGGYDASCCGGGANRFFNGLIQDEIFFNTALSTDNRNLMEQYLSAKWNTALTPPGTGATEAAKAMASNGYSVFVSDYLERLSNSADISLLASNNITLDLKGDTLNLANGRSLTLTTTNGNISSNSAGSISATRNAGVGGNITMTAGGTGSISLGNVSLTANSGGSINLTSGSTISSSAAMSATSGGITMNAAGNITTNGLLDVNAGTITITTTNGGSFGTSGTPVSTDAGGFVLNTAGNSYISNARGVTVSGTSVGGNFQLRNSASGNITVNNLDVIGTTDIQAFANSNSTIGGTGNIFRGAANINTNDNTGGHITMTSDFRGNTSLTGDRIQVTDTAGDFTVTTLSTGSASTTANPNTLTANTGNLSVSGINLNSTGATATGHLDASASGDISINGSGWTTTNDIVNAWSTGGGDMTLSNTTLNGAAPLTGTVGNNDPAQTATGIYLRTTGAYTLTNNSINGNTSINATGAISGTGNTFTGTTLFDANQGTAYDINITSSNFVNTANTFDGANVTLADNNGAFRITSVTATGTGNISASNGDLTLDLANITGNTTLTSSANLTATNTANNFGTITASANGDLSLYEAGTMNINSVTNTGAGATSDTVLVSIGGDILGKGNTTADITTSGTGDTLFIAGITAADTGSNIDLNLNTAGKTVVLATGREAGTNNAIELRGNVNGNLEAMGWDFGTLSRNNAAGHIILGDAIEGLAVTGTTQFRAANTYDAMGVGSFGGAVAGQAGRIGLTVSSGNFTAGTANSIPIALGIGGSNLSGLTAGNATGWWGAADESLIINTVNGDILGTGYTTSGAANIRLQAGTTGSLLATNNINVNNVVSGGDLALYATGDSLGTGNGTAIQVGGTSTVAGTITASGFNASNYFSGVNGAIDITLSSGNLNTALAWTQNDNINLTTTNGGILQNFAKYGYNGKTIYTNGGDVTLTANGAGGYINTGVNALTAGSDLTAKAGGQNGGLSVQLYGRVDGNLTVHNTSGAGNAVTGNVNLGTSLGGSITNLNDTYTVEDVLGTTTVRALGDVGMYGMFIGAVSIYNANDVTIDTDKGSVTVNTITATGDIDITSRHKSIIASTLQAANDIHLTAGSALPSDKFAQINVSNITASGNLNAEAWGTTTGNQAGNAIIISGSVGGSKTTTTHSGGVVSVP